MTDREPRCRMYDWRRNPCPNPALDPDPKAPQICVAHAAAVIKLVAENRAQRLGLTRRTA